MQANVPAIPQLSFNTEYSNQYDSIVGTRYANLLNNRNAFGLEISFGAKEFRLAGTSASLFNCQHMLRLTAEYFAQNTSFIFDQVRLPLWDEQYALGADYTYLTNHYGLAAYSIGVYEAGARDEHLEPRIFVANDYLVFRDVKGSLAYGGYLGFTLQPWRYTKLHTDLYYDNISYNNKIEPDSNRQGVGLSATLEQVVHPRILFALDASDRRLYSQYGAKASWLIPTPYRTRLELTLHGHHVEGELQNPTENRVGLMLSYRWGLPSSCQTYLTTKTIEEDVLAAATHPVVRMPQVFAARDQAITPRPEQ